MQNVYFPPMIYPKVKQNKKSFLRNKEWTGYLNTESDLKKSYTEV